MDQVENELNRIWRRLNALEGRLDNLNDALRGDVESLRGDVRDLRGICVARFNGVEGHVAKTNWGSVIALLIAAAAGIGVPVGVALLIAAGGT